MKGNGQLSDDGTSFACCLLQNLPGLSWAAEEELKLTPEAQASVLSRITFWWLNPLLLLGNRCVWDVFRFSGYITNAHNRKVLQEADLFRLQGFCPITTLGLLPGFTFWFLDAHTAEYNAKEVAQAWATERVRWNQQAPNKRSARPSLARSLFFTFVWQILKAYPNLHSL